MRLSLSRNTQAILMLTAPLLVGRTRDTVDYLKPGEYGHLLRFLRDRHLEPADLLSPGGPTLIDEYQYPSDGSRIRSLLARGFLLSQAVDRWHARAIWVVSSADPNFPARLSARLGDHTPPILYGCGDTSILESGGLAVVGSRHVALELVESTLKVGMLAAAAGCTVVSGGAKGIDQAAMQGAVQGGGKVVVVLPDSLERAAMNREHRDLIMDQQLVLVSPYDPSSGFNVGNAMQRNKLIYAFADAALVVNSDCGRGGTWTGAVEQLKSLHLVPVYVRSVGDVGTGLQALGQMGAMPWPNPESPKAFNDLLIRQVTSDAPYHPQLMLSTVRECKSEYNHLNALARAGVHSESDTAPRERNPAEELFAIVRSFLQAMDEPTTDAEVAAKLNVSQSQAKAWLQRLVREGVLCKQAKPVRYRSTKVIGSLF